MNLPAMNPDWNFVTVCIAIVALFAITAFLAIKDKLL